MCNDPLSSHPILDNIFYPYARKNKTLFSRLMQSDENPYHYVSELDPLLGPLY